MNIQSLPVAKLLPRVVLLLTVAVALLGGMGSGLARLGWPMDSLSRDWLMLHGPLMISGFLGTLICLERAVALAARYRWSLIVPAVNALGTVLLLTVGDTQWVRLVMSLGSLGLVVLFVLMVRLHPSRDVMIMAAGAAAWLIGNVFWFSLRPVYDVVHLWSAFLILTVVGERLELSRVRRLTSRSQTLLTLFVIVYLGGVLLTPFTLDAGVRVLGVGAILLSGWLLHYDVARRTIRQSGLPRYIAACLLLGYAWLGFGGVVAVWNGAIYAGPDYAVVLHAFLLGFIFSMIFGHAPIILPALTGLQFRYTPLLYGHLLVLHITLSYRMFGSLTRNFDAQKDGGLWNVISILLFLSVVIFTLIRSNVVNRRESAASA